MNTYDKFITFELNGERFQRQVLTEQGDWFKVAYYGRGRWPRQMVHRDWIISIETITRYPCGNCVIQNEVLV